MYCELDRPIYIFYIIDAEKKYIIRIFKPLIFGFSLFMH